MKNAFLSSMHSCRHRFPLSDSVQLFRRYRGLSSPPGVLLNRPSLPNSSDVARSVHDSSQFVSDRYRTTPNSVLMQISAPPCSLLPKPSRWFPHWLSCARLLGQPIASDPSRRPDSLKASSVR